MSDVLRRVRSRWHHGVRGGTSAAAVVEERPTTTEAWTAVVWRLEWIIDNREGGVRPSDAAALKDLCSWSVNVIGAGTVSQLTQRSWLKGEDDMIDELDEVRLAVEHSLVACGELNLDATQIIASVPVRLREDRAMEAREAEQQRPAFGSDCRRGNCMHRQSTNRDTS